MRCPDRGRRAGGLVLRVGAAEIPGSTSRFSIRQSFPRDKVCGGWITPAVLSELAIDPAEYARGALLQPITGFRTGLDRRSRRSRRITTGR